MSCVVVGEQEASRGVCAAMRRGDVLVASGDRRARGDGEQMSIGRQLKPGGRETISLASELAQIAGELAWIAGELAWIAGEPARVGGERSAIDELLT